jgi:hypothetical protein
MPVTMTATILPQHGFKLPVRLDHLLGGECVTSKKGWQLASDSNTVKGKPYRLEIDPPGLNRGIQPVQGVAHREGSEGSSHQQAEK